MLNFRHQGNGKVNNRKALKFLVLEKQGMMTMRLVHSLDLLGLKIVLLVGGMAVSYIFYDL